MIARTDLLSAIGITEFPTKLPEFVKMLEEIKAAYPDMIPLTAASGWLFSNIASAYNVTGMYQLIDGKVTALESRPAKRWEGLVDKLVLTAAAILAGFVLAQLGIN